ncbi:unnamed protein product, partial [Amoebophrya sp. A25]
SAPVKKGGPSSSRATQMNMTKSSSTSREMQSKQQPPRQEILKQGRPDQSNPNKANSSTDVNKSDASNSSTNKSKNENHDNPPGSAPGTSSTRSDKSARTVESKQSSPIKAGKLQHAQKAPTSHAVAFSGESSTTKDSVDKGEIHKRDSKEAGFGVGFSAPHGEKTGARDKSDRAAKTKKSRESGKSEHHSNRKATSETSNLRKKSSNTSAKTSKKQQREQQSAVGLGAEGTNKKKNAETPRAPASTSSAGEKRRAG